MAVQAHDYETKALVLLGDAELALGRLDAAQAVFTRAQTLSRELGYAGQHDAGGWPASRWLVRTWSVPCDATKRCWRTLTAADAMARGGRA